MSGKPHLSVVSTLYETNFRDVAATLRNIADDVEAGKFGTVGCCALALLGDRLEVFGIGPDSDATAVGMVLLAAANKMARPIEEHGT